MRKVNTLARSAKIVTIITVLLTFCFMSCAFSEEVVKIGYNTALLNIRSEPNTDCRVVDQYVPYSTIEIYYVKDGWCRVEKGFVSEKYVLKSLDIYDAGIFIDDSQIYEEPSDASEVIGTVEKEYEGIFISKENGFVELQTGGYVPEKVVSFDYAENFYDEEYTINDMKARNMSHLKIKKIGTLKAKTTGQGVTTKGTLNFVGDIPIYEVINGYAYFPSGRHIYKIPYDNFIYFEPVGPKNDVICAYRTVYYSSTENRKFNISKVASKINGTVIRPGGTFSYNKTTGPRNEESGYKVAKVIQNGEYIDDFGGGVCQVSSTIYAAVLNTPKFSVTKRKAHGLEVNYLPQGMDATVSYDAIDFCFKNNFDFSVKINIVAENGVCFVTITRQ